MDPNIDDPLNKLGLATKKLYETIGALRDVIHVKNDEVARLDKFENKFWELKRVFEQYKKMETKHVQKTKGYQDRIQQEIVKGQYKLESLKKDISNLTRFINEQDIENDKSERELTENVERLRLIYTSEDSVAPPFISNHTPIIKRSCDEQAI